MRGGGRTEEEREGVGWNWKGRRRRRVLDKERDRMGRIKRSMYDKGGSRDIRGEKRE